MKETTTPYEFKNFDMEDQQICIHEEMLSYLFEKLRTTSNYETVWSDYESLNESFKVPKSVKYITNYQNQVRVMLDPEVEYDYIDLWPLCEQLYMGIGYYDHRYIECFEINGDHIQVFFGS